MIEAGIPSEAIGLSQGATDVGASILAACKRSMIFGSAKTVEQYRGNPGVQVHGPGFSKILIGDDMVDEWEKHLDLMAESINVLIQESECLPDWVHHNEDVESYIETRNMRLKSSSAPINASSATKLPNSGVRRSSKKEGHL
jgi:hypothetical protein